ncbi:MAG: glucose-6-phosphate isomerase [Clostridiales Family XIII bacterium]|jgi:glucose-6-phosphate isomerase|nr:glucose-6-phosphate isomerase [Clostridiales Family XIII bacterium]
MSTVINRENGTLLKVGYDVNSSVLEAADGYAEDAKRHFETLKSRSLDYTGWVEYASRLSGEEVDSIRAVADEIRSRSTVFVVIGIGGSYLGAKAALEFIGGGLRKSPDPDSDDEDQPGTRVVFAGFNLSGSYHRALIEEIKDETISICQISKSGGTVEPSMAFLALRELLISKYGEAEADARTYVVTDPVSGSLRKEATAKGWKALAIPPDVGGRFSVLTPVGLLPIAVAGIDIKELLAGAKSAEGPELTETALRLASVRRAVQDTGKKVEVIGCFEPSAEFFIQWILQLYGESEGKDGKGMLPQGVSFSRDLHSLGQFLQDGAQIFSEMLISIKEPAADTVISSPGNLYTGRGMNEFNRAVRAGMIAAHRGNDIPIISLNVTDTSAYSFGQMAYFLELTCGVTGLLMGVDPFNQPGVEAYKSEMRKILGI